MKILLLHSDFIEWEPKKKALKMAEKAAKKPKRVNNALVVLSAVEEGDETDGKRIAEKTAAEIVDVLNQVKAKNVVLYPYAHLSASLAKPASALKILRGLESELKGRKLSVFRAPFGWYKAFNLKCKGHPLAELSKHISFEKHAETIKAGGEDVSDALKVERKLKSSWFILTPQGKLNRIKIRNGKISGFDFSKFPRLEKLARYEMEKSRLNKEEPPHIALMKKLELVGYESGSDPGNLRFAPKGKLVKSLIEEWVTSNVIKNGAMEVETPIMYDIEHPSLKKYMHRFPARQYTIKTPNKNVFLRFSACFGQFLLTHDAGISYRNLPMRMFEMASSFRVEQRGELAGLRRLRKFTMPDVHALCRDIKQAKEEMLKRLEMALRIQEGLTLTKKDFEFALRSTKDFYKKNRDYVMRLVKKWGRPVLVEIWEKKFFYFILKYEFNFVDSLDKASALTTDQIDVENGERFEILFTDKDNSRKHPIILHMSPSGAIERVIYALLERAYIQKQAKKNPVFPMWLSPTQVRLCPVNDSFNKYCVQMADKLEKENIRVDMDDRTESVQKKIRDAEVEWIPLIVVVGGKEKKTGKLAVRFRVSGKIKLMKAKEIVNYIKKQTKDKPFRRLSLPRLLTKRPVFAS